MTTPTRWQPLDLSHLRQRLEEVKLLLEQAAAVGLVQDRDRLGALTELHRLSTEERRVHKNRRRYR